MESDTGKWKRKEMEMWKEMHSLGLWGTSLKVLSSATDSAISNLNDDDFDAILSLVPVNITISSTSATTPTFSNGTPSSDSNFVKSGSAQGGTISQEQHKQGHLPFHLHKGKCSKYTDMISVVLQTNPTGMTIGRRGNFAPSTTRNILMQNLLGTICLLVPCVIKDTFMPSCSVVIRPCILHSIAVAK